RKALRNPPADSGAHADLLVRLSEIDEKFDDRPGAIAALKQAAAVRPFDPPTAIALARALEADGQHDEAFDVYRKILGTDPADFDALIACGAAAAPTDVIIATACVDLARQIHPDDLHALDMAANLRFRKGAYSEAAPLFRALSIRNPSNFAYHRALALIYDQGGDKDRALEEWIEALKLATTDLDRQQIRDIILRHTGGDPALAPI